MHPDQIIKFPTLKNIISNFFNKIVNINADSDNKKNLSCYKDNKTSLSLVSHELKSPIASIASVANLINSGQLDAAEVKKFVADIEILALESLDFIDDLLNIGNKDLSELDLTFSSVSNLIKSAIKIVRGLALRDGIQLSTDIEESLPLFRCDSKKIKQLLVNLLTNSVKYSPNNSQVLISARDVGGKLNFCIKDQGIGMSKEEINDIYNIHKTRKLNNSYRKLNKKTDSSGIGLPFVKEIVDLHHGKIEFTSLGQDRGLEVNLIFDFN